MSQDIELPPASDAVEHETFINAPTDRVWHVLTDAEHIRHWYAYDGATVDLRPGGELVFHWKEHGTFRSVIEAIDPGRSLRYRASTQPDALPTDGAATVVEFTLGSESGGTRLRVVESGIGGLDVSDDERREHAEGAEMAWAAALGSLAERATAADA